MAPSDFELVIWIDYKRSRELLGCTGKLREDQNTRDRSGSCAATILLRDQVHAVAHRRDERNPRKPEQGSEYGARISTADVLDWNPARLAQRTIYPPDGFINRPAQYSIFRDFTAAGWRDLQKGDAPPLIRLVDEEALVRFHLLSNAFRVIKTIDADDQFTGAKAGDCLANDAI